jgi:hypothetical protein
MSATTWPEAFENASAWFAFAATAWAVAWWAVNK